MRLTCVSAGDVNGTSKSTVGTGDVGSDVLVEPRFALACGDVERALCGRTELEAGSAALVEGGLSGLVRVLAAYVGGRGRCGTEGREGEVRWTDTHRLAPGKRGGR